MFHKQAHADANEAGQTGVKPLMQRHARLQVNGFRYDDERRMVAAVLAAIRDPELCPIHLPVLRALLAEELRKIPKGKHRAEEKEGAA